MHGDRTQSQREKALGRFHAGSVDTLVATDVAARGIDVDDITHVINFDAPEDRDMYVHRVGRTGRAGHSQFAQSGLGSPRDERGHGRRERSRNGKRRSHGGRTG